MVHYAARRNDLGLIGHFFNTGPFLPAKPRNDLHNVGHKVTALPFAVNHLFVSQIERKRIYSEYATNKRGGKHGH